MTIVQAINCHKTLIASNNIRIVKLENDRCKIVEILIFRSLYWEQNKISKLRSKRGSLKSGSHGDYKNKTMGRSILKK